MQASTTLQSACSTAILYLILPHKKHLCPFKLLLLQKIPHYFPPNPLAHYLLLDLNNTTLLLHPRRVPLPSIKLTLCNVKVSFPCVTYRVDSSSSNPKAKSPLAYVTISNKYNSTPPKKRLCLQTYLKHSK